MNERPRLEGTLPGNMRNDHGTSGFLYYLYCIAGAVPLLRTEAAAGDMRLIEAGGVYAVVGRVSSEDFSEENLMKNLRNIKWLETRVIQHQKIIEETMAYSTVVPFKFATIFRTEERITELLEKHGASFRKAVELLEGGEEWGVKVYCDLWCLKVSLAEAEEIKKIEEEISVSTRGRIYFLRKRKDRLIEDMILEKISEYGQDSFDILRKESRDACINKPLSKQASGRNDAMVLNAAFLVDKTKLGGFIESIDCLKERYHSKGLYLECTGPWPPYNFCSVTKDIVA
jgi:Gas vesicle synthesis protein GvpL/GvpF